tara:strand:+ start:641 stop:1102 length:462 start_codon:yes stop_codon:yes gene_type:complete
MPKYTPEQIKERNDKVEAEMLEAQKQYEIEQEQAQIQKEKQQAKLDNSIDGYYVQVLGDNEYGPQMVTTKKDDSYELIIPFVGQVTKGYELYVARNDAGILEQRIREADLDYAGKRKNEYPKLADQLDMIYHDIDAWRETIKEIKNRNPKGEE